MEKNAITILLATLLILVGALIINLGQGYITGNIVENNFVYSFTKAVCNDKNYCEDYEVVCNNYEIVKLSPTGAAVQFPNDWEDPREKEEIEIKC